jgi:glycosyltransferase involved in cell wall biosynthesis
VSFTLSIVIPAFNEEDRILTTIQQTLAYCEARRLKTEILVVSDGSTDRTPAVAAQFDSGAHVHLEVLAYQPNRGKGYAVRYGMLRAKGEQMMFMDADYSVEIQEVEKGLALLSQGFDVAIASRALPGSVIEAHQNLAREFSARTYTLIQMLYLGLRYKDTQCGFKLFRRPAARDLFGRQKLHSVIFDPEILWLAKRHGYRVAEFPVKWRHVGESRIQYDNLRKSLFVFQELFRIRGLHAKKNE